MLGDYIMSNCYDETENSMPNVIIVANWNFLKTQNVTIKYWIINYYDQKLAQYFILFFVENISLFWIWRTENICSDWEFSGFFDKVRLISAWKALAKFKCP